MNFLHHLHRIVGNTGLTWSSGIVQVLGLVVTVLAIVLPITTTIYCIRRHRDDFQLPMWLMLTWLVPIAGAIATRITLGMRPRSE